MCIRLHSSLTFKMRRLRSHPEVVVHTAVHLISSTFLVHRLLVKAVLLNFMFRSGGGGWMNFRELSSTRHTSQSQLLKPNNSMPLCPSSLGPYFSSPGLIMTVTNTLLLVYRFFWWSLEYSTDNLLSTVDA